MKTATLRVSRGAGVTGGAGVEEKRTVYYGVPVWSSAAYGVRAWVWCMCVAGPGVWSSAVCYGASNRRNTLQHRVLRGLAEVALSALGQPPPEPQREHHFVRPGLGGSALELVSGADFWCKLTSGGAPGRSKGVPGLISGLKPRKNGPKILMFTPFLPSLFRTGPYLAGSF